LRTTGANSVLVIEESVPEHDRHAGGLYIWQMLQLLLEEGVQTSLFAHDGVRRQPYADALIRDGVEVLIRSDQLGGCLRRTDGGPPAVIVARPHMAQQYLDVVRANTSGRVLYYTHDVHHVRLLRQFRATWDVRALRQGRRLRGLETRIFRTVDGVITPSVAEVEIIAQLAPATEVTVVPPYVNLDGLASNAAPLRERNAVVMVGGFKHQPNVDAAIRLVRDVMPPVWKAVPWARVKLAGGDAPDEILALANDRVDVLGYVPNLDSVYADARMSVNPIRYGAGVKGKILSSLEAGIPVITTTVGNEGIGLESGSEALIADSAKDLAAAVVLLYRDPELLERLAVAGRRAASEKFSKDGARRALVRALHLSAPGSSTQPRRP
jgi:glycosyltransferase involved in cell wall biosynthesis